MQRVGRLGAIDPEVVLRGKGKHLHYSRGVTVEVPYGAGRRAFR